MDLKAVIYVNAEKIVIISEEQENEMEECIEDCEVRYYNDPVYLDYCLDGCEDYEQSIIDDCEDECGNLPEEQREVVNYDVQLNIWYNTGFTETFAGQPNVIAGTPVFFWSTTKYSYCQFKPRISKRTN